MKLKSLFFLLGIGMFLGAGAQNVGIGTTSPTSKLDVNGQVTIDQKNFGGYGGLLIKGNAPNDNYPNIAFSIRNNAATPADVVSALINGRINSNTAGSESMDLSFLTSTTGLNGLSQRLVIKGNGNIGIGNITPGFPLNFSSSLGDKISLWGSSDNHYGFGVQSGLLQIHADESFADIGFGWGSSGAFTERMRIINSGTEGMVLNGRLTIKNGTNDGLNGGGVWLYKADNSGLLGFMGAQNNQNIGFYGGPAGWGFTYDALNSRLGINTPVTFNGNAGAAGDVPTSNGTASAPAWASPTKFVYDNSYKKSSASFANVGGSGNPTSIVVPDLSQVINVPRRCMALVTWNYEVYVNPCALCGDAHLYTAIGFNGNSEHQLYEDIGTGKNSIQSGSFIINLDPGTYNVEVIVRNFSSSISATVGGNGTGTTSNLSILLFPQ